MFNNILVPTDGSDLAAKAVEQGVRFAKEIGAKITAMTVTEPFHFLSVSPSQLEYTPIEYQKYSKAQANKVLGVVSDAAKSAGVVCETLHVEHELGTHRRRPGFRAGLFGASLRHPAGAGRRIGRRNQIRL